MLLHLAVGGMFQQRITLGDMGGHAGVVQGCNIALCLELGHLLLKRRQVALDRGVFPRGVIAFAPIGVIKCAVLAVHIAAVILDQIAVETAQRIVVERGKVP